MEERILAPLDGSKVGEAILPKIEDLVLRMEPGHDFEIILLQVVSQMNFNYLTEDKAAQLAYSEDELADLKGKAQNYLDKVAARIRSQGIKVRTLVTVGSAAEEIVNTARGIDAHLIAMSTHGRSGLVRWAIGSVTDQVMHLENRIPVLAIKASRKPESSPVLVTGSLDSLVRRS
jgi:nucleotide-binding universal stress UspA family protein